MQTTYDTPITARAATVSAGLEAVSQRLFTAAATSAAMPLPAPPAVTTADPDALLPHISLLPQIELREYLFVIFRHWRVPAVMVFVAAIVSATLGMAGQKTYSAVATIAMPNAGLAPQQVLAAAVSDSVLGQLVESGQFSHLQRAMQPLTAADLRAQVQVTSADNVVFSVAVRDSSAAGAALLANTLADKVVQYFAGFNLTPALRKQLADAGISLQQLQAGTGTAQQTETFAALKVGLEQQRAALDAERAALEAPRTALDAERAALEAPRTALEVQRTKLQAQRAALEVQRTELQAQRTAAEVPRTELQAQRAALEVPRTELQAQLAGLDAQRSDLEAQVAVLQAKYIALNAPGIEPAQFDALTQLIALRDRLAGNNQDALSGFGDFALALNLLGRIQNTLPMSVGISELNGVRTGALVASISSSVATTAAQFGRGSGYQEFIEMKAAYAAEAAPIEKKTAALNVQQIVLKAAIAASGLPIMAKDGEIALKNVEIAALAPAIDAKNAEIAALAPPIDAKNVEITALAPPIAAKNLEIDAKKLKLAAKERELDAKKLELDAKKLELDAIQKTYDAAMVSVVVPHGAAAVPDTWVEPNVRKNVLAATGAALALSLMLVFGYEYVWGRGLPGDTAVPVQMN